VNGDRTMRDILNLGCGRKKMADAVNLDISGDVGADVVHDLAAMPWPLPADTFREVHATDVIEHLDDTLKVMEEIHRICQSGAVVHVTVPHFSSANAFTDPTHRKHFSYFSFDYFDEAHPFGFYSRARFRRVRSQIVFDPTWTNKLVHRLANRNPRRYEQRWAWMFPAWFLSIDLEVVK